MAKVKTVKTKKMAATKPVVAAPAATKVAERTRRRPTVMKDCGRCKKKGVPHGTFYIKAAKRARTAPWCRGCDAKRRAAARAGKRSSKGRLVKAR